MEKNSENTYLYILIDIITSFSEENKAETTYCGTIFKIYSYILTFSGLGEIGHLIDEKGISNIIPVGEDEYDILSDYKDLMSFLCSDGKTEDKVDILEKIKINMI